VPIVYAILAAGSATRMGYDKAVTPLAGRSPLARLNATLGDRNALVVTNAELREACARQAPGRRVLVNERPERGMTSSLRTADRAIDSQDTIAVLLADKPLVTEATLALGEARIADGTADVVYPVNAGGTPGHPVWFGPRARALLAELSDGDTLHRLRDDPTLVRATIAVDDTGAFCDLNTPRDWESAEKALRGVDR
jgi:nicotine blue oxidoreductase